MRIVVDTNVVVSGLRQPLGNPAHVLAVMRAGAIVPVYDARILAEYSEVLARPRLRLAPEDVAQLLDDVGRLGEELVGVPPVAFVLPDPKDQPFLEVALAAQADAIVTGNLRDFPDACGLQILSPAQIAALFPR